MGRVGTCSICGGDVIGHRGAWWAVVPPPPDRCSRCGAVAAGQTNIIPMVPAGTRDWPYRDTYWSGNSQLTPMWVG